MFWFPNRNRWQSFAVVNVCSMLCLFDSGDKGQGFLSILLTTRVWGVEASDWQLEIMEGQVLQRWVYISAPRRGGWLSVKHLFRSFILDLKISSALIYLGKVQCCSWKKSKESGPNFSLYLHVTMTSLKLVIHRSIAIFATLMNKPEISRYTRYHFKACWSSWKLISRELWTSSWNNPYCISNQVNPLNEISIFLSMGPCESA